MLQPSVKLRLSLHERRGGKGARQQFEGTPHPTPLGARSGSISNYKQGLRKAASLILLTLRAREACAELTEGSERAGVPPAQPVALLACPGLLPRPAGWFFFFFLLLLRHSPCLSQVSGRTGSAAGSGRGRHGTARHGTTRRRWRRESFHGGVTL